MWLRVEAKRLKDAFGATSLKVRAKLSVGSPQVAHFWEFFFMRADANLGQPAVKCQKSYLIYVFLGC